MARAAVVALFDIDGTLIDCGGAGRRAMAQAFEDVAGRSDLCSFRFGGMTDRAIARQGLAAIDRATDEQVEQLVERYLHHLERALPTAEQFRVHDAVVPLLDALEAAGHAAIGLGTGNVARGAELKLRHAGLWQRFAFGGYGCDHEDRAELLRVGASRGRERATPETTVVVIGDTPKDVAAAMAIGARCVAVATGAFTEDELRAAGAELVVPTLADVRAHRMLGLE
jgi:phosphoglycolate phosphatase